MLKNKIILLAAVLPLAASSFVMADQIVGQSADKTVGKTLGGWSAFLMGGAAGGPVGAIVGGLAGAWAGGEIQEANDASGNTYQIRKADGELVDLRSPNHEFAIGDEVVIQGIRPLPLVRLSSNSKKLNL